MVLHLLLDQPFVVQVSAADTRAFGVAVDDVGSPYVTCMCSLKTNDHSIITYVNCFSHTCYCSATRIRMSPISSVVLKNGGFPELSYTRYLFHLFPKRPQTTVLACHALHPVCHELLIQNRHRLVLSCIGTSRRNTIACQEGVRIGRTTVLTNRDRTCTAACCFRRI